MFLQKTTYLDFIHGLEISRNTIFYLKATKKPQIRKK